MKSSKFTKQILKDKKILITNCWLSGYGGSEINILQLVDQLISFGARVECFTHLYEGEMAEEFSRRRIKVISESFVHTDTEKTLKIADVDIDDYDYIWVCQQVLPLSIVKQLNSAKKRPKFIFLHMSALVGIPVEAPVVWGMEGKLYDMILSISDDTTANIRRILGSDFRDVDYYRNPVPVSFSQVKKKSERLKKIAVISNHPPKELVDVKRYIEQEDIEVEYFGSWSENYRLVDADLMEEYDAIVGIGKNVQYGLVAGVPIYLYDYFGGCGYLNNDNYQLALENNFSGRGFDRKSAREIAGEIIQGYRNALNFHTENRQRFIENYSIDKVLESIFTKLDNKERQKPKTLFSREEINYIISMQVMLQGRSQSWATSNRNIIQIKDLQKMVGDSNKHIELIEKSKAYRIGKMITLPVRYIKKLLNRALIY